jgi:glycosyltransferase involved in cell wall biosynthesis
MLSTAHVLCMTRVNTPYANGGFPYKVGDYVAMGRPVLATDVSDIRKYLIDRESAMIVESGSRQKMAEALDYLLRHPEEADRIGAKGRAVGEKYFNPDINAGLMADFCSTL